MNKTGTTIVIVIIVALGLWLLLRDQPADVMTMEVNSPLSQEPISNTPVMPSGDSTNSSAGVTVDTGLSVGTSGPTSSKTVNFTVDATNFKFAPATMSVNKGDTVRITLTNGQGSHDLKVDGYNIKTKIISTGGTDTIQFVADTAGTFEYYCTIGNHRAMGMNGTLTVK